MDQGEQIEYIARLIRSKRYNGKIEPKPVDDHNRTDLKLAKLIYDAGFRLPAPTEYEWGWLGDKLSKNVYADYEEASEFVHAPRLFYRKMAGEWEQVGRVFVTTDGYKYLLPLDLSKFDGTALCLNGHNEGQTTEFSGGTGEWEDNL